MNWFAIVNDLTGELLGYSNEDPSNWAVPEGASIIPLGGDSAGRAWDPVARAWGALLPPEPEAPAEPPSAAAQLIGVLASISASDRPLEDRLADIVAALAAQSS